MTFQEKLKHYDTCSMELEPDEAKRKEESFGIINIKAISRCTAEKVGLIDEASSGRINPKERSKRNLISSCIMWDDCWEDNNCDKYSRRIY